MKLSWDLSQIYATQQDYLSDKQKLKELGNKLVLFKGKLNNKKDLLNYFVVNEEFSKIEEKLVSYLFFTKSLDGSNIFAIEELSELEIYLQELNNKTVFISQELKKIPNKSLQEFAKLPEFKDYDLDLLDIIKDKKHTLPESQEKLMIGASFANNNSELFDCLNNVEIKYGKTIDEQGKIVTLNKSNSRVLTSSHIKKVRLYAYVRILRAYKAVNQTIASNYISHLKYSNFVAKTYKYKNTLDLCLNDADLPNNLPQSVVKNVTNYLPLLHSYYAWRKQFMGLKHIDSNDLSCNLFDRTVNKEYTLQEGVSIIKEALQVLGPDYINLLDKAIENKWIDSEFAPNKESGAYSSSLYGVHPFILLTYDKTQDSVSTLAHELGHAMHSYYSEKAQPYAKHNYEIFVAEVASTVNEVLLANYFINNAKNNKEKIAFITDFLNTFVATVFTQTQYTEFELFAHNAVDKGEPLSYKKLNDCYLQLQKKYCGKNVLIVSDSQYHWSRVPHFYRSFYVFKYATGFISACAIAQKLLTDKNYLPKYKEFLSAGGSKKPCDILKLADVDILDSKTYKQAFKLFDNYLNILKNTKE